MFVGLRSDVRVLACAGVVLCVLLGVGQTSARAETRVVITIDVESQALPLPQQIDVVCQGSVPCGLMAIVAALEKQGVAATFFLDVYEHRTWGETALREIATRLRAAGQDVELHTHPQWAYDPRRIRMEQYTLEEQTAIVRDGVTLLARWTGDPVVAHRAGDYGADVRTLEALRRNGIVVDSSLFFGNARSPLSELGLPRNRPSARDGVVQIPVTVYERNARPMLIGGFVSPLRSIRKIDPDWFISADEATAAIDAAVSARLPYVVVFLHSFSFLTPQAGTPVANEHSISIFQAMLQHIAERRLPVVTMRQVASANASDTVGDDVIPTVTVAIDVPRYVWHRLPASRALFVASGTLAIGILAALFVVAMKRRRPAAMRPGVQTGTQGAR